MNIARAVQELIALDAFIAGENTYIPTYLTCTMLKSFRPIPDCKWYASHCSRIKEIRSERRHWCCWGTGTALTERNSNAVVIDVVPSSLP
ncbi:hypothetical protein M413DRAFT_448330 [Hebeloma cylindrosporum]|uniref:Uncharacterized protein n=1 Tax=Hebeloma cylindrosporum TaxID=76867 RepID=A0A0C2XI45_HEBCY|nr:hypothetical protein M413DRAFT_448330 [Hebeloma cylindrosporum h7]